MAVLSYEVLKFLLLVLRGESFSVFSVKGPEWRTIAGKNHFQSSSKASGSSIGVITTSVMKRLKKSGCMNRGKYGDLYKGILQIGVGIYHAKRSNLKGAMRLVSSGMELLSPFAPECMGVDVTHLLQSAGLFRKELNGLASDPGLSLKAIPIIRFIE